MINQNTNRIIKLGNCSTGTSEGGMCYSIDGVSQTITAGTHGWGCGNLVEYDWENYEDRYIYKIIDYNA